MKIKKYIKDYVVIAEDNTLWEFSGLELSREVELNTGCFSIHNGVLYFYDRESFYNPIRQLTQDEVIDYLHLIL
jgi:DNA modification methylase